MASEDLERALEVRRIVMRYVDREGEIDPGYIEECDSQVAAEFRAVRLEEHKRTCMDCFVSERDGIYKCGRALELEVA